jgi:hypothetical protein
MSYVSNQTYQLGTKVAPFLQKSYRAGIEIGYYIDNSAYLCILTTHNYHPPGSKWNKSTLAADIGNSIKVFARPGQVST